MWITESELSHIVFLSVAGYMTMEAETNIITILPERSWTDEAITAIRNLNFPLRYCDQWRILLCDCGFQLIMYSQIHQEPIYAFTLNSESPRGMDRLLLRSLHTTNGALCLFINIYELITAKWLAIGVKLAAGRYSPNSRLQVANQRGSLEMGSKSAIALSVLVVLLFLQISVCFQILSVAEFDPPPKDHAKLARGIVHIVGEWEPVLIMIKSENVTFDRLIRRLDCNGNHFHGKLHVRISHGKRYRHGRQCKGRKGHGQYIFPTHGSGLYGQGLGSGKQSDRLLFDGPVQALLWPHGAHLCKGHNLRPDGEADQWHCRVRFRIASDVQPSPECPHVGRE